MTTTTDTEQMLRDQCASILETIGTLNDYEASQEFMEGVLDVTASGQGTVSEGWTVHTIDLLLTFGGPTIKAKIDPESYSVEVVGYWGGDTVRLYGEAGDAITEWTREYVELMEGV